MPTAVRLLLILAPARIAPDKTAAQQDFINAFPTEAAAFACEHFLKAVSRLVYCSICLPTMLAVVSATLSSVSPMRADGSRESRTTAPMDSPSAMIGQITCAV